MVLTSLRCCSCCNIHAGAAGAVGCIPPHHAVWGDAAALHNHRLLGSGQAAGAGTAMTPTHTASACWRCYVRLQCALHQPEQGLLWHTHTATRGVCWQHQPSAAMSSAAAEAGVWTAGDGSSSSSPEQQAVGSSAPQGSSGKQACLLLAAGVLGTVLHVAATLVSDHIWPG